MKKNYSAPALEQVRMEAEMPVMQTSAGSLTSGNISSMKMGSMGTW
ncbi:MAG: hypothetical protein MJ010_07370 [Paludibacteraceae bacterium]|nr:hypothetical protein [Paludibacteraceae bacterium]